MLTLIVPEQEFYNEETTEFVHRPAVVLELEHSLVSLSKWESRFNKPFLGQSNKTPEEVLGYIEAMCLTPGVSSEVFQRLSEADGEKISAYMESSMTATTFYEAGGKSKKPETITAELIYYWMIAFQIPFEWERRHLNQLFTLIRVASHKQSPPKKMSPTEVARRNAEINARRRAELNTAG